MTVLSTGSARDSFFQTALSAAFASAATVFAPSMTSSTPAAINTALISNFYVRKFVPSSCSKCLDVTSDVIFPSHRSLEFAKNYPHKPSCCTRWLPRGLTVTRTRIFPITLLTQFFAVRMTEPINF